MIDQKVVYPVILTKDTDDNYPYTVYLPDFDGYTEGKNLKDALSMAQDYIGTYSLENELPKATEILPATKKNETPTFVTLNISEYQRKYDKKVVKKTLTIPGYLNEKAKENNVNFSDILTQALKKRLGVK